MQQFSFSFERTTVPALPADVQELIAAAKAAVQRAYAPYSNFRVGAAVRLADGTIRIGANHENASYPAGVCAERSILYTLDPTNPNEHVKAIGICYQGRPDAHEPLAPCGICRQVLLETQLTQGFPIEVYMCGPDGDVLHISDASMLLPFYFSGEHLPE